MLNARVIQGSVCMVMHKKKSSFRLAHRLSKIGRWVKNIITRVSLYGSCELQEIKMKLCIGALSESDVGRLSFWATALGDCHGRRLIEFGRGRSQIASSS